MKVRVASAVALAALIVGLGAARADDNLHTLEGFRMTAPIDWPTVPQTGPKADSVRQILKDKINLPPGFHIELYALVPDARHMAVGPQGVVTFVGTRKNKIWAVTDRSRAGGEGGGIEGGGIEVKEFAPTLAKRLPKAPASRRTASSMSSSRTGSFSIRRLSSSTRARMSRSASSFPRGS